MLGLKCILVKSAPVDTYVTGSSWVQVITVTSWWARWRLKSPASQLFGQPFVQTQIKENIKALRHWSLWFHEGNQPVTGGFSSQRASNAENISMWWRHYVPSARATLLAYPMLIRFSLDPYPQTSVKLESRCSSVVCLEMHQKISFARW